MQIPISNIIVAERYRTDFGPIDELARSITDNGLILPIAVEQLADGTYDLLAGERRLRACRSLNWETIEARIYEGPLTDLERRSIELEENIQRKDMTWLEECTLKRDIHNLRLQIHGKKTIPSADAPGWSMRDTAKLLDVSPADVSLDLNLAKAVETFPEFDWESCKNKSEARKQVNKLTKTLTRHAAAEEFNQAMSAPDGDKCNKTILHKRISESFLIGDCVEMMRKLPANFADFVEIDPPYAIELNEMKRGGTDGYAFYNEINQDVYLRFMNSVITEAYRIMKPNAWLVLWFGPEPWFEPLHDLLAFDTTFNETTKQIVKTPRFAVKRLPGIWTKSTGQTQQPLTNLANCYEMFFYARKGNAELQMPGRSNLFNFEPLHASKKRHPTERPAALIQELLNTFTTEGSQVVVPFAGSGRTMLEAWRCQRFAIGYDLSEDYRNGYIEAITEEF